MAILSLQLSFFTAVFVISFCTIPSVKGISAPSPPPSQSLHDHDFPTTAAFKPPPMLEPILTHLGFQELSTAVTSLSLSTATTSSAVSAGGPLTIFAPSDSSIRTCPSCSLPRLLEEHTLPGLFTFHYLRSLAFGTKIETILPGRCITVTATANSTKIFVGGAEISRPDLFNNGFIIIHGLQGFLAHLSPFSCSIERMSSLSFTTPPAMQSVTDFSVMRLMLRDAMLRLRISGFSVLSLAIRVKYPELVSLHNMTIFALDDEAIFNGGHTYVSNVRYHIVPNRMLTSVELDALPVRTLLPTLDGGENLVVTTSGEGAFGEPMRINYVWIKRPEVMRNIKVVVHGLSLPFPHIHPTAMNFGVGMGVNGMNGRSELDASSSFIDGGNGMSAAPSPLIESTVDMEDRLGL
ncbi:FAS1 domain [Dillenia turbinata]|uniref:FAS1 domain n=1 Tax=Dillenia turbinata TaxID=194707 RepID=A0AAN8VH85_9MAGN